LDVCDLEGFDRKGLLRKRIAERSRCRIDVGTLYIMREDHVSWLARSDHLAVQGIVLTG
jgi:hypothetical protein